MTLACSTISVEFGPARSPDGAGPAERFGRAAHFVSGWWRYLSARLVATSDRPSEVSGAVASDLPGLDRTILAASSPMTSSEQWRRLARHVEHGTANAHAMRELHAAAERHLNAVEYALDQLIDDLSSIMPPPRPQIAVAQSARAPGVAQVAAARPVRVTQAAIAA